MKYQMSIGPRSARPSSPDPGIEPTWTIEELSGADAARFAGHAGRTLGFTIAALAAIICFGFASRVWRPPPAGVEPLQTASSAPIKNDAPVMPVTPQPVVAFTLVSPAEGAPAKGGVVTVNGIANVGLRNVHLAIVLGDAVLGWRDIGIATVGPVRADIPIFAPGFDVPVRLEASVAMMDGSTEHLDVGLVLKAGPRVSLWRTVASVRSGGAVDLVVDGYAPSAIDALTIDVRTRSDHLLARAVVQNAVGDERPGSDGGRRLGLGTFHRRIVVAGPIPAGGWLVEIAWRASSDDSAGSVAAVVSAISR